MFSLYNSTKQMDDVLAQKHIARLRRRLRELDRRTWIALELRFNHERTIEETARLLKVSRSTVKTRTREGLAWLRGQMDAPVKLLQIEDRQR
jgi:DNA-directed RNA polymerase specialized sigma subunit